MKTYIKFNLLFISFSEANFIGCQPAVLMIMKSTVSPDRELSAPDFVWR